MKRKTSIIDLGAETNLRAGFSINRDGAVANMASRYFTINVDSRAVPFFDAGSPDAPERYLQAAGLGQDLQPFAREYVAWSDMMDKHPGGFKTCPDGTAKAGNDAFDDITNLPIDGYVTGVQVEITHPRHATDNDSRNRFDDWVQNLLTHKFDLMGFSPNTCMTRAMFYAVRAMITQLLAFGYPVPPEWGGQVPQAADPLRWGDDTQRDVCHKLSMFNVSIPDMVRLTGDYIDTQRGYTKTLWGGGVPWDGDLDAVKEGMPCLLPNNRYTYGGAKFLERMNEMTPGFHSWKFRNILIQIVNDLAMRKGFDDTAKANSRQASQLDTIIIELAQLLRNHYIEGRWICQELNI
jgi:hypothetical protein